MSVYEAQEPAVSTAAAIAPGVALAAARRAQNLGVEDVARQLRLSAAQVRAIEAGAHEQLPAPVFVRGFIRNYARLLRMDADALLKDAEPAVSAPAQRILAPSRGVPYPQGGKSRLPRYAMAALALLAGLAWYEFYWTDSVKDSGRRSARVTTTHDASPLPIAVAKPIAAAVDAPALAPAAPQAASRLHLVFKGASWVEVRDRSGAALLSQTQPAGTERTLEGVPPFSLVIGNAQAVRLTYGDKPVDLAPHIINTVARMTLE